MYAVVNTGENPGPPANVPCSTMVLELAAHLLYQQLGLQDDLSLRVSDSNPYTYGQRSSTLQPAKRHACFLQQAGVFEIVLLLPTLLGTDVTDYHLRVVGICKPGPLNGQWAPTLPLLLERWQELLRQLFLMLVLLRPNVWNTAIIETTLQMLVQPGRYKGLATRRPLFMVM
jgi:hypothetical protein